MRTPVILLVDADTDRLLAACQGLSDAYRVLCTSGPETALVYLQEFGARIDAVVVASNGTDEALELTRQVRCAGYRTVACSVPESQAFAYRLCGAEVSTSADLLVISDSVRAVLGARTEAERFA